MLTDYRLMTGERMSGRKENGMQDVEKEMSVWLEP